MSDQNPYNFLHDDQQVARGNLYPFLDVNPMMYIQPSSNQNPSAGYGPSYNSTLTECLQGSLADYHALSSAFDLSCNPLSEAVGFVPNNFSEKFRSSMTDKAVAAMEGTGRETPRTPISSVSSASSEAGVEEDSSKSNNDLPSRLCESGEQKSKKVIKGGKKREKKPKGPRFAFMTKSEVDHLEDGYRWRKYGQKAVKNSSFPRSYYRCTSQKCTVKKRVERSYQDPSIVVTTYEGQHNHHTPSALGANAAASFFDPSLLASSSSQSLLPLPQGLSLACFSQLAKPTQ